MVIYVDNSASDTDTEDEIEAYDVYIEDDEQYRADVYDCDTKVDVRTDNDTVTVNTLSADNSCTGDTTLTADKTLLLRPSTPTFDYLP